LKNANERESTKLLEKAEHVFQAMSFLADDVISYRTAIALLAVHSCILMNDALLVMFSGVVRHFDDHMQAIAELEGRCKAKKLDAGGVRRHLGWLIGRKTKIEYSGDRISDDDVKLAVDHTEKFFNWAYTTFKGVLRA
jgi:hypothetical protein